MGIPLFGKNDKTAERLAQLQSQEYNKKMLGELKKWGLEKNCVVEARLIPQQTLASFSFKTILYFRQMTMDEKQIIINAKEEEESNKE